MPDTENGLSVIVCCYNSAERLPETIRHLALQDFGQPWELVIVNNNSSDDTAATAQNEWRKYHVPNAALTLVDEGQPGLNHARKTGVAAARFEYVLFCDDDNWLQHDFIAIAYSLMRHNPSLGAAGGECVAVKEGNDPFPEWFESNKNNYAVGKQAAYTGDVTVRGYLWGAGLVTTKTIFNRCLDDHFPFLLTDRQGSLLSSGGDTELCSRIILCGYRLYYDERLKLRHFVPANRLTLSYFEQLKRGIDAAHEQLSKYYLLIRVSSLGRSARLYGAGKSLAKIILAGLIRRWDGTREKQVFYCYTGIDLGVGSDLRMLKKFKHDAGSVTR